ncbi:hypothetical protein [uncultured Methylophaga sp.]|uniref:hypothetical protein n=1 Tax=uncultured Methylophaga sp. TaxID=285271 RepID=UPI00261F6DEB|nr:hypothetical protein [uncultured Methylophaga sp.]
MDKLLAVLREQAFDKKPTVDELKKLDGLDNVTAKERDDAWKKYQEEQQAKSKPDGDGGNTATGTGDTGDADQDDDQSKVIAGAQKKDDAAGEAAKSDAQNQTTVTTTTTDSKPDAKQKAKQDDSPRYRVTVKRDGFRRLGRAWTGRTEVALSDEELAVLEADPMFNVDEL